MKKSILMITLGAIIAFSTISCKEDLTGSEILSGAKNGWKLTVAVSDPAYLMSDSSLVSDLITGYLEDCERDDIMYFQTTNAQVVNPGKDKKTTDINYDCVEMTEKSLGNWSLSEDEKTFTKFYLPYFPDENLSVNEVVTLNETTLTVKVPIKDDANDVTFTLTYTKQ